MSRFSNAGRLLPLPDSKTDYKATVIETVHEWTKLAK